MSGIKVVPLTPAQIVRGMTPGIEWERPDFQEHFTVEEGSPDGEEEESRLPRQAKQFVRKHKRRENRLRAKGRIA